MDRDETPWYRDGLRFGCTQCGDCCTGEPGYVWIDTAEAEAIAAFVRTPFDEFLAVSTRLAGKGRTLRERADGACVFYECGRGCTIYPVRPRQCRTWPFWESTVRTPADWRATCEICPGAGRGELIPAEEITHRLRVIKL